MAYYHAYDARYRTAHKNGVRWMSQERTPIVLQTIEKYQIAKHAKMLEIGCGEGRDAVAVLQRGYDLTATDCSREAIRFCKQTQFAARFQVLDCLNDTLNGQFDFVFAVAVLHMLVLDADRDGLYRFVHEHLTENGLALLCSMGDGENEMQSDISKAFTIQAREHESGTMHVAATSCRMVSFATFERECKRNQLEIVEEGLTESLPDFNQLMFAIVRRA